MLRAITLVLLFIAIWVVPPAASAPREPIFTQAPDLETAAVDKAGPIVESILGDFTFDGAGGTLDPQGWVGVDAWAQADTFFRVEDFAGMGVAGLPLTGNRSLWCGRRPDPASDCPEALYPGYGNNWVQDFTSQPFVLSGPGDVDMSYDYRVDFQDDFYDVFHVQYLGASGIWHTLAAHTLTEQGSNSVTAPGDSLSGSVRFRFLLETDYSGSDEDGAHDSVGAVILDEINVAGPGVLAHEDFEDETVGAAVTNDGAWSAQQDPGFGNYAGLFDGGTVLQEDPQITNNTGLWGFFQGSTDQCVGYGSQPVVPSRRAGETNISSNFIFNEIRSPEIDLTVDEEGDPVVPADNLVVDFDVYRDLDLESGVFYGIRLRYRIGGCLTPWEGEYFVYYGNGKDWYSQTAEFALPVGASHVQVALFCKDLCDAVGQCDSGACHSQAPLFDNIRVRLLKNPLTVTNGDDSGPGSLRDAITQANLLPDHDRIVFDISGTSSIIQLNTPLPALSYPTELDATTNPGYGSEPVVELDGSLVAGLDPAVTVWDSCAVRGLAIHGFPGNGIRVRGIDVVIEACHIGRSPYTEAVPGNGNYGVSIDSSARNCRVGGPGSGQGNVITGHPNRGVVVEGSQSTGHSIRGNSIYSNGWIGIDLGQDFVTFNDADDADTGSNNLQNFPVVTLVNTAAGVIEAELSSQPDLTYEVDFYQSTNCAVAGYGEGQAYFGTRSVTTDSEGMGHLRFTTPLTMVPGRYITATATDAQGNTSEFSMCFEVPPVYQVTNINDAGAGSLRQAILDANGDGIPSLISFDIPLGPALIIYLSTALPALTEPVVIDGFSQPGAVPNTLAAGAGLNGTPAVMLFGPSVISGDGLHVLADDCRIQGLSICAFPGSAIRIQGVRNRVLGCYLGVQPNGVTGVSNAQAGVRVDDLGATPTNTYIGGVFPAYRNLISANSGQGVAVLGGSVSIRGNLIGTDAGGLTALGNNYGVEFNTTLATNGGVGDNSLQSRNVISGNIQLGVQMSSDSGWVVNNFIGVGVDGTTPLGNGTFGVLISGNSNNVGPGAGNVIAHNGFDGVRIFSGSNNRIRGNSIHSNAQLGIDVEPDGVTPTPGSFTPVPVLTGVDTNQNQIFGTMTSTPNTSIRVQFFANAACDPSGYGEGEIFLGESLVTTDGGGTVAWTFNSPANLTGGEFLTATAEHPTLGTSEFSLCLEAANTPAGSEVAVNPGEAGNDVTLTFDNVNTAGNTSATSDDAGPAAPENFSFSDPLEMWSITTTAVFSDSIEVCLPYDPAALSGDEADLVLLHWDETLAQPAWVDITSSRDPVLNIICGRTASLSPFAVASPTLVSRVGETLPRQLGLHAAVPNPFNPSTTIHFEVPSTGRAISLNIYDIRGRLVRTLAEGHLQPGRHQAVWQGTDNAGRGVASGVYIVRLDDGNEHKLQKIVLVE